MDAVGTPHNCGIYRGIVTDVDAPRKRLRVAVPELSGMSPLGWALPCLLPGSTGRTPVVNTAVWVMFENGDAMHPVWLGTWLGV